MEKVVVGLHINKPPTKRVPNLSKFNISLIMYNDIEKKNISKAPITSGEVIAPRMPTQNT